ncbi:unnamed protein product [Trichobilharzia regenti]|nr:unnamed protein product [Trichobilharzia regenti]
MSKRSNDSAQQQNTRDVKRKTKKRNTKERSSTAPKTCANEDLEISIDKCHLLQYTTRRYDNAGYLEFRGGDGIEIFLPQPAPNEFTFTIGIYDEDIFGGAEKIATLIAQHFTLFPTNQWTAIPMVRDTNQYYNNIL